MATLFPARRPRNCRTSRANAAPRQRTHYRTQLIDCQGLAPSNRHKFRPVDDRPTQRRRELDLLHTTGELGGERHAALSDAIAVVEQAFVIVRRTVSGGVR
jgi:hypothetical protein